MALEPEELRRRQQERAARRAQRKVRKRKMILYLAAAAVILLACGFLIIRVVQQGPKPKHRARADPAQHRDPPGRGR